MKKLLALVLSLVMVLACGAIASADGEVVNVMYGGGTPETLDPALNSASTGSNTIRLAFCGLMGTAVVDGVASKAPEMAESYEISDDGLVYTFKLREGLKWSDGSDFFASDFVKSWNRAADPALGADYGFLFDYIARNEDGTLNAVADDEARTLVVTLVNPCCLLPRAVRLYHLLPGQSGAGGQRGRLGDRSRQVHRHRSFPHDQLRGGRRGEV